MNKLISYRLFTIAMAICLLMSSCTMVKDIFKAGMIFGVLGVVALVMLLFWVIKSLGK